MPTAYYSQSSHQSQSRTAYPTNEQNVDFLTSPRLSTAIGVLRELDNQTILAWLTGLRTFKPDGNHWFQPNLLRPQHLNAISSLKEFSDGLVLAWLDSARCTGSVVHSALPSDKSNVSDAQHVVGFSAQRVPSALQGSPNSTTAGFFGPLPYIHDTGLNVTQRPFGQKVPYHDIPSRNPFDEANTPSATSSSPCYGCPSCENHRTSNTCDGWKRHMKAHEILYICRACEDGAPGKSRSYTRRANLAKHLVEDHKSSKSKAAELADEWRRKDGRTYYSCGFCVILFQTIMDQLNHIDTKHFRNFQSVSDWDINMVIRGLLLQPEVKTILHKIFGIPVNTAIQGLTWNPSAARSLQLRLELSEEPAEDLATAVANHGSWDETIQGRLGTGLAAGVSDSQMEYMMASTQILENEDSTSSFAMPDGVMLGSSSIYSAMPKPQTMLPNITLDAGHHHASRVFRPILQPSTTSNWVESQRSSSSNWSHLHGYDGPSSMGGSFMIDGDWSNTAPTALSSSTARSHSSSLHHQPTSIANGAFGTESPGVLSSAHGSSVLSMDLYEGESTDTESSPVATRMKKQRP